MSQIPVELMAWLRDLRHQVAANPAHANLEPKGEPIPFFGDIRSAKILTVGVNPSRTEFNSKRWDGIDTDSRWTKRLIDYFHQPNVQWHPWFLTWEAALMLLGCSYEDRSAAHLDLSPRATVRMSSAPPDLFNTMVQADLHWLFESIAFCPNARVVLAAGSLTNQGLVGNYLREQAHEHGFSVEVVDGIPILVSNCGRIRLPLLSFPKGPSAPDKFELISAVFDKRDVIRRFLD